MKKLDLTDRLSEAIDTLQLPIELVYNINTTGESFALYAQPGGTVVRTYYNGIKDKVFPYEIRGKGVDPQTLEQLAYEISQHIESLNDSGLNSSNGSFELCDIVVSDEPYFTDADDDGNFYFTLAFNVTATVFP